MRRKRFSEEQIVAILKESAAGMRTEEICRRHEICSNTFYRWKAKYAGMEISDVRRLKALQNENTRLKKIVAEQALDIQALKVVVLKKVLTHPKRREAVGGMVTETGISERRACRLVGVHRWTYRYPGRRRDDRALRERKKIRSRIRTAPLAVPSKPNERWSMDYMQDRLADGRKFRVLTIVDDFTRECPAIEVDTSLPGARVVRVLEKLAFTRGLPQVIVSDNGSEFTGRVLDAWANRQGVRLHFVDPGSPMQNEFVESVNGKLREECLNLHWFHTIEEAKEKIEAWRVDYNEHRPHSALNDQTPSEFAENFDLSRAVEKAGF